MTLLNEEARKIRQRYRKALLGIQVETPTWKRCVEEIGFNNFDSSNFIYVASSMYVKKYFKPEAKKEMIELTDYIRKAFEDIVLPSIDWMDEKVKEKAKKKLAEMDQFIAYSDEFLNKEKIDELYQGLEISENDLFGNSLKIYRFWRTFIYNRYLRAHLKCLTYLIRFYRHFI
jgi:predicted metalloendopeptidase